MMGGSLTPTLAAAAADHGPARVPAPRRSPSAAPAPAPSDHAGRVLAALGSPERCRALSRLVDALGALLCDPARATGTGSSTPRSSGGGGGGSSSGAASAPTAQAAAPPGGDGWAGTAGRWRALEAVLPESPPDIEALALTLKRVQLAESRGLSGVIQAMGALARARDARAWAAAATALEEAVAAARWHSAACAAAADAAGALLGRQGTSEGARAVAGEVTELLSGAAAALWRAFGDASYVSANLDSPAALGCTVPSLLADLHQLATERTALYKRSAVRLMSRVRQLGREDGAFALPAAGGGGGGSGAGTSTGAEGAGTGAAWAAAAAAASEPSSSRSSSFNFGQIGFPGLVEVNGSGGAGSFPPALGSSPPASAAAAGPSAGAGATSGPSTPPVQVAGRRRGHVHSLSGGGGGGGASTRRRSGSGSGSGSFERRVSSLPRSSSSGGGANGGRRP